MTQTKSESRGERVSVLWWIQWEILPHLGENPTWDPSPGPGGLRAVPGSLSDLLLPHSECCAFAPNKNTNASRRFRGLIRLKHDARTKHADTGISAAVITAHMSRPISSSHSRVMSELLLTIAWPHYPDDETEV